MLNRTDAIHWKVVKAGEQEHQFFVFSKNLAAENVLPCELQSFT